jgi:hypothetical protein
VKHVVIPFFRKLGTTPCSSRHKVMRKTPTQLERQLSACLAQHGELDYAALMTTAAANSPLLARTLQNATPWFHPQNRVADNAAANALPIIR